MVERRLKNCFASDKGEHDAKDRRHRKESRKARAKAVAAERGKRRQDDRPDAEAKEYLARTELARKLSKLGQGIETPPTIAACSEKIVDRNRLVEVPRALVHGGNAGPAFRLDDPLCLDKGRQNRERQI